MTQGGTLSDEEMAAFEQALTDFARHHRASKRRALKAKMLRAIRESNGTIEIDSLTSLTTAVDASFANEDAMKALEALQRAMKSVEIRPAGKGERKRAGAERRRMERLRSRKGRI